MEEGWKSGLMFLLPFVGRDRDGGSHRSKKLLAVLLLFSFSSQFLPIEPYLVPYLISVKHFSNFQVTIDIYPCSIYAQLFFTLLLAPACFYLSHKVVILLGTLGMVATYIIAWAGKSLFSMKIMQVDVCIAYELGKGVWGFLSSIFMVIYGFGMSTRLVFSSYIFHLVAEEEYQTMTSLTTATSLLSFMIASELGQFLALIEASYRIFFVISLTFLGICSTSSLLLPKDQALSSMSMTTYFGENEGWIRMLKETWRGRTLKILSLWSAFAYAGFCLVQNYGANLFDAINPDSKLNGHIFAASQAVGSLGSFSALYLDKIATKGSVSVLIYVLGSASMSIFCVCMATSAKIWAAYLFYIAISGIYQALACLVSVRCCKLLCNGQYILLFSLSNVLGLLLETLLQAAIEISGLAVSAQFLYFSGFFFMATAVFIGLFSFGGQGELPTPYTSLGR